MLLYVILALILVVDIIDIFILFKFRKFIHTLKSDFTNLEEKLEDYLDPCALYSYDNECEGCDDFSDCTKNCPFNDNDEDYEQDHYCEECNYFDYCEGSCNMNAVKILYKQVHDDKPIHAPYKGSAYAAAFDLCGEYISNTDKEDKDFKIKLVDPDQVEILPGECVIFGTNIAAQIPEGYYLDICPRSGLGIKQGLQVSNSPARIDSDYRGEIFIGIRNTSNVNQSIKLGSRIAQTTLHEVIPTEFFLTKDDLSKTERNDGGLGHSGVESK